jgi:hypothetical protein
MSPPPVIKKRAGNLEATSPKNCDYIDPTALVCSAQAGYERQACTHDTRLLERMPFGHVHYALERCGHCRAVLRWIARPATLEARKKNAERIAQLARCDGLTNWEREFVRSVAQQPKHSPKQLAIIEKLCARYLKGVAP